MTTLTSPIGLCAKPFRVQASSPRRDLALRGRVCSKLIVCGLWDPNGLESKAPATPNLQELQSPALDASSASQSVRSSPSDQLEQRERLLWDRQEALWQQHLSHWQHERDVWTQREATLMAHIEQLHSHIRTHLTSQSNDIAATSRQSPPSPLAIEPAEPGLLEPIPATELTTLATNAADSHDEPEAPPTPQPSVNSAATQQQPAAIIPSGPPPALCMGSDDIYWVNQLQSSLTNKGYYCGEEESEDFIFGSDTESAVTTFQACNGLEESGVVNEETWKELLGPEMAPSAPPVDEELLEEDASSIQPLMRESPAGPSTARSNRDAKDPHPWQASWGDLFSSNEDNDDQEASQMSQNQSSSHSPTSTSRLDSQDSTGASTSAPAAPQVAASRPTAAGSSYIREETDYSKWTVLREGDGGRHVHELQVALTENGFWPGDDDMTWWQFGDATCSAVQTFQASVGLPQSGVATGDTWQALLGKDAKPADAAKLAAQNETDDDMTAEHGGVYLVGEQRWAKAS